MRRFSSRPVPEKPVHNWTVTFNRQTDGDGRSDLKTSRLPPPNNCYRTRVQIFFSENNIQFDGLDIKTLRSIEFQRFYIFIVLSNFFSIFFTTIKTTKKHFFLKILTISLLLSIFIVPSKFFFTMFENGILRLNYVFFLNSRQFIIFLKLLLKFPLVNMRYSRYHKNVIFFLNPFQL